MGIVLMPIRIRTGSDFSFWCRSRPEFGSNTKFYTCWKIWEFLNFYSQKCQSIHCALRVIILSIPSIYCNFLEKGYCSLGLHLVEMDMDVDPAPDLEFRRALDTDPDPAKWCRSDWIWIHNTDKNDAVFSKKIKLVELISQCDSIQYGSQLTNGTASYNSPTEFAQHRDSLLIPMSYPVQLVQQLQVARTHETTQYS